MCLGVPMRVLEQDGVTALCERRGEVRRVRLALVGDVVPGGHVLVHVDTVIRVIDAEEAALVDDALDGLEAALDGRSTDAYFADLAAREPELPPHLRPNGEPTS